MNKSCLLLLSFTLLASCNNTKVEELSNQLIDKDKHISQLAQQIDHLQNSNTSLLDRMSELSVINQSDAKSIQSSLENINRQNQYITDLNSQIQYKDSINFALVTNLKRSLIDINDEDLEISIKGSAIYVSISDHLLFNTGSTRILSSSSSVLNKVASVINDHNQLNVLVEGHTDNVPINNQKIADNWDLSVLRATAIVRELQDNYFVDPERMTAAGRAHYIPKMNNGTTAGRKKNRRTEIIITPKLDQFFKLLEHPELAG